MNLSTGTNRELRPRWFLFAVCISILAAGIVASVTTGDTHAATQINPANQINWPSGCTSGLYYQPASNSCGSGGSMVYPGAGIPVSTGSAWGTSLTKVGTDAGSPTAGTLSGTGNPACVDSNGGLSTGVCGVPLALFESGTMTDSQLLWGTSFLYSFTIPSGCPSSFVSAVAASSTTALTLVDVTTSTTLCTITFTGGGSTVATVTGSGGTVSVHDVVRWVGASTHDANLASVGGQIEVVR